MGARGILIFIVVLLLGGGFLGRMRGWHDRRLRPLDARHREVKQQAREHRGDRDGDLEPS